jgi:glycosyltransferase involved in cell wall biosynthesis
VVKELYIRMAKRTLRANDLNGLNSFKSMNVLIITGIFPPDIGGPATYVPTLGSELVKRGHKITVVTLSDNPEHDDRPYPFRVLRIRRSMFKPWRFMHTAAAILREGRPANVLYVNGLQLEAVVANFFLRKPLVQKIVGDWAWERATNKGWVTDTFEEFQNRRHGLKVELLKALRHFCACRSQAVIVPSRYLARAVANWGVSEKKIAVIYNSVEPLSLSADQEIAVDKSPHAPLFQSGVEILERRKIPLCKGGDRGIFSKEPIPLSTPVKVVTVGRLVPWKRVDHLIEALAGCAEAGLVIVGDGPQRHRLEGIARELRMDDRVYFAGQRTKAETLSLMAACDLFVLNSTYEGFPHVVLEAMSVGLPVVATAVGGTPELVRDGENGLLIAPNANGALSKTLMKLVTSSEGRQRLAAGAQQTMQRFQRSAMIEATEAALQACAF